MRRRDGSRLRWTFSRTYPLEMLRGEGFDGTASSGVRYRRLMGVLVAVFDWSDGYGNS